MPIFQRGDRLPSALRKPICYSPLELQQASPICHPPGSGKTTVARQVEKILCNEMGSRYLFICLYVWLEKYFSRGDYRKAG
jgi:hypothetical protein